MLFRTLAVALPVLALAACAPDRPTPAMSVAGPRPEVDRAFSPTITDRSPTTLPVRVAVETPPTARTTPDPISVRQACDLAEKTHPLGLAAAAGEAVASGEAQQARAYPNPRVAVSGGRARSRAGAGDERIGAVELTQPIEFPGKRAARASAAFAGIALARVERELAIRALRRSVRSAYAEALHAT
ncbi:MAG: TolC family protein, partial [Planctomycetes bacterium]|nr:TolC family protein [Planctomycetota bacterium]